MRIRVRPAGLVLLLLMLPACPTPPAPEGEVVANDAALREALASLAPGDTLLIAPGDYTGGLYLESLNGLPNAPITIAGQDASAPPRFTGGGQALHLVDCNYVTLRDLHVQGYAVNGINADDGGSFDTPAKGLLFEAITIEDIGPTGNHDALKLSGVDDFEVRECVFRGWGGSAIDMVGCHDGVITGCTFTGLEGYDQSSAVQIKGGSRNILVERSFFDHAGARAINLGGSTGLDFFRPQDSVYEAKEVEVGGNVFLGGETAVAWVTADGGYVHHNTIVRPGRWVLRILQETTDARFIACREGLFEHNIVVYDEALRTFVNVGPNTAPETFVFRNNAWYDEAGSRTPDLPTEENGGVYQVDPMLSGSGMDIAVGNNDARLAGMGTEHYGARR